MFNDAAYSINVSALDTVKGDASKFRKITEVISFTLRSHALNIITENNHSV